MPLVMLYQIVHEDRIKTKKCYLNSNKQKLFIQETCACVGGRRFLENYNDNGSNKNSKKPLSFPTTTSA